VNSIKVKEIMVPLQEYGTVSQEATLYEAILQLEQADDQTRTTCAHRAVLVTDDSGRVVGKLAHWEVLKGLEPKYNEVSELRMSRFGLDKTYLKSLMAQYELLNKPLEDLCKKAARIKVKELMSTSMESDYINEEASLNEAIHQMIMDRHQYLLATREKEVVGVVRLSDIFLKVCHMIKQCPI